VIGSAARGGIGQGRDDLHFELAVVAPLAGDGTVNPSSPRRPLMIAEVSSVVTRRRAEVAVRAVPVVDEGGEVARGEVPLYSAGPREREATARTNSSWRSRLASAERYVSA
jgi:hypothetical protein